MREWLTPQQVAERLHVAPKTLANWRSLSIGPRYVKAGRLVRYWSDDVAAWMESR